MDPLTVLFQEIERSIADLLALARTGPFAEPTLYDDVRQLLERHAALTGHRPSFGSRLERMLPAEREP